MNRVGKASWVGCSELGWVRRTAKKGPTNELGWETGRVGHGRGSATCLICTVDSELNQLVIEKCGEEVRIDDVEPYQALIPADLTVAERSGRKDDDEEHSRKKRHVRARGSSNGATVSCFVLGNGRRTIIRRRERDGDKDGSEKTENATELVREDDDYGSGARDGHRDGCRC
ncbi:hypothetical protein PIB30_044350 [Stylosanthes scabra]|uniref:Uncharacterized protein n=1 Tax=Stylosanthes scabra TaxID=79078 RepID=A0ABU6SFX1_9FABA|nr:hypothetical protein [Stylosanthes scabra]